MSLAARWVRFSKRVNWLRGVAWRCTRLHGVASFPPGSAAANRWVRFAQWRVGVNPGQRASTGVNLCQPRPVGGFVLGVGVCAEHRRTSPHIRAHLRRAIGLCGLCDLGVHCVALFHAGAAVALPPIPARCAVVMTNAQRARTEPARRVRSGEKILKSGDFAPGARCAFFITNAQRAAGHHQESRWRGELHGRGAHATTLHRPITSRRRRAVVA